MPKIIHEFQGPYRFLSNFWPCTITYEGLTYHTLEAAFQAAKTLDPAIRQTFVNLPPGQAKRRGRTLTLRPDWDFLRIPIMLALLRLKFSDPDLRAQLLATVDATLEEGNGWGDNFWGVYKGEGQNQLGRLLMQVRAELAVPTIQV